MEIGYFRKMDNVFEILLAQPCVCFLQRVWNKGDLSFQCTPLPPVDHLQGSKMARVLAGWEGPETSFGLRSCGLTTV